MSSTSTTRARSAALLAGLFVVPAAGAVPAAGPSLTLTPSRVHRGDSVLIRGAVPGCPAGDAVTIISRAFYGTQRFAGVAAVFAKVRTAGGGFRTTTRIPPWKAPGLYTVTARCGGGNLGVAPRLRVLR